MKKIFNGRHTKRENITEELDAEGIAIHDILWEIANKVSQKIENPAETNKTIRFLKLTNFFFKSFVTNDKDDSGCAETAQ